MFTVLKFNLYQRILTCFIRGSITVGTDNLQPDLLDLIRQTNLFLDKRKQSS